VSEHTLLLADLVDSTSLVERLGDARAAALWAEHDQRARRLIALHAGREIDRSDGFFLIFERPGEAVRFAAGYHRVVAELGLAARVGLHQGTVSLRHNPPGEVVRGAKPVEVEGLAKPLAARIMALAGGGRTLLSATTAAAIDEVALEGHRLHRHGHYRFKGIQEPVEVAEMAEPSAACLPPDDGEKAYRVVRVGELWRPVREVRHNLTPERDAFVGRQVELRRIAEQFEGGTRLLTLLGPGGTGKTRLARRYAMAWLGEWPGGVYFCDLSEARSLEGIHFVVALALGVPLSKGDASAQLGHAIAGRGRCLVILDNFEQVQAHAQATLGSWIDRAPQAHFAVTSRERLRLAGEMVEPVHPLALTDDAITLFGVRARAQQPDFVLDPRSRHAVAEIVRLLDGLPLAIELAAARIRVMSPAQIVERLKDRFTLLAGARGVAGRQATLKAAIDWSWDLLAPWEQAALAQCSVFDGGFTLEAAEAVLALGDWPEAPAVLEAIQSLVDKCLLRAWLPKAAGRLDLAEPFFGMYLSIHEYASQKLWAFGERAAGDAMQRHGGHFAGFGCDDALDSLLTQNGVTRRQTLALELDNLVTACRRAIRRGEPEVAAACYLAAWAVLEAQGPFGLAATLGQQLLGIEGLSPDRCALVQIALADALRAEGKIEPSGAMLTQALATARRSGAARTEAVALRHLAVALYRSGHNEEARRSFDEALALHEALNDRAQLGVLNANLANFEMELGRMSEARVRYATALALHREVGNRAAEGITLGNLATLDHELGYLDEARTAYDASLIVHREAGSLHQEAITLANLGILHFEQGAYQDAAALYREALRIHRETGNRRSEGIALGLIGEYHMALGEQEPSKAHLDEALRIHREVGNRRFEGGALGTLGELLLAHGRVEDGMQMLASGIGVLREVGDLLYVAKLLCSQGGADLARGDRAAARTALDEAETIHAGLGAATASDLGRRIAALRRSLERSAVGEA
jgi:predicted ATPase/class 3 adenylate cyclase/Tfp pilus assembly protein PilF